MVSGGASPVNPTGFTKDHFSDLQNLAATKNGYLYVYVSNESPVNVFFDNLQLVHIRSPLLEETHYYPFGLTMVGISSKAVSSIPNKEKTFQGQQLDNELELNWVQFKWRNHDPQIGRFVEIDPISETYVYNSTYAFSENKVIRHIELEGLESADSQDPAVRALMKDNVQRKMTTATNSLSNAGRVDFTAGLGVGVKASVGSVKVEAGVSGPQAKVSVNVGGDVSTSASAASAGVKVSTSVGDANAGVSIWDIKIADGKVSSALWNADASANASASASKSVSDGNQSASTSASTKGEISAGVKFGIGIFVTLNPLKFLNGAAKSLDALFTFKVEEVKEKSGNPMVNKDIYRGPDN